MCLRDSRTSLLLHSPRIFICNGKPCLAELHLV